MTSPLSRGPISNPVSVPRGPLSPVLALARSRVKARNSSVFLRPRPPPSMEKAKQYLAVGDEASEAVSRLAVPPRRAGDNPSFYESFSLRGLRVDRVEPGLVVCSFKVPPRLAVSPLNPRFAFPPEIAGARRRRSSVAGDVCSRERARLYWIMWMNLTRAAAAAGRQWLRERCFGIWLCLCNSSCDRAIARQI